MSHRFLCLIALASTLATAATAGAPFLARDWNQDRRIAAGVATGALTVNETARLSYGEARVGAMLSRFASDGRITPREAFRADRALDQMSRRIFIQKHDAQVRPAPVPIPLRRVTQDARIDQGIATGSLTPREVIHVRAGQVAIGAEIHRARADGVVTPRENRRIRSDLNWESDLIYREKHD